MVVINSTKHHNYSYMNALSCDLDGGGIYTYIMVNTINSHLHSEQPSSVSQAYKWDTKQQRA